MAVTLHFTIPEACEMLAPAISEAQLRELIHALRWQPAGRKYTGHAGRPTLTWDWSQICELHAAISPWLG